MKNQSGSELSKLRSLIISLLNQFKTAGAIELDLPALLDADALIDLYGEDLRTRAFSTFDPIEGEKILRPDFTVPVVQYHIDHPKEEQKYAYAGPVWRCQEFGSKKPREYYQVGIESFHMSDPAYADAEIFNLIKTSLDNYKLDCEVGDMGLLRALVMELDLSNNKKRLLLRHLWRADRFVQLLIQYSGELNVSPLYQNLKASLENNTLENYIRLAGPEIGLRKAEEVKSRVIEMLEDELVKPIPTSEVRILKEVQDLTCKFSDAPKKLKKFKNLGKSFRSAFIKLEERIEAMSELNLNVDTLPFYGSSHRTGLEYYDGFIFKFYFKEKPDLPPVAQGGRYNALTKVLNKGLAIPAVGGIIRPEILKSLESQ